MSVNLHQLRILLQEKNAGYVIIFNLMQYLTDMAHSLSFFCESRYVGFCNIVMAQPSPLPIFAQVSRYSN